MMYGPHIAPTNDQSIGHADADWGGESDRKSVSGFVITLGNVPVSWAARNKQQWDFHQLKLSMLAYLKLQGKPSG
jgi:hypothetical protein